RKERRNHSRTAGENPSSPAGAPSSSTLWAVVVVTVILAPLSEQRIRSQSVREPWHLRGSLHEPCLHKPPPAHRGTRCRIVTVPPACGHAHSARSRRRPPRPGSPLRRGPCA